MVILINIVFERDGVRVGNELRKLLRHVEPVATHVFNEVLRAHRVNYLDQLIVVVRALEEGVHFKEETSEGASHSPHIQRVVVLLVLDEQLGAFVVAGGHTHVVVILGLVKVGQPPIDQSQVSVIVVDYDVERLHVAVHDAMHVRVLKSLEDHVGVQPDIHVIKATSQHFCLYVRDVLEDESWGLGRWVAQNVVQLDDVGTTVERLQYFDLTVLLLDADGLQNFNDALFVVSKICTFEHFRVLAAPQLVVYVIIIEGGPVEGQPLVIRKAIWALIAHKLVWSLEHLVLDLLFFPSS